MLKYYEIPVLIYGNRNSEFRKGCLHFPPIHTAVKYGQLEVVKLIHQFDKDCNRLLSHLPGQYFTPLSLAIRHNQTEVVKYFIENEKVSIYSELFENRLGDFLVIWIIIQDI